MTRSVVGLLLVLALAVPARAARYSYDNCIKAFRLACRHIMPTDQVGCVATNARQCADCELALWMTRHQPHRDLGSCASWLDGTTIRIWRHADFGPTIDMGGRR